MRLRPGTRAQWVSGTRQVLRVRDAVAAWASKWLVHLVALLALVGLLIFIATEERDSQPLGYDACLAYLSGWIFNLLVVVLPERRRVRGLVGTLKGSLMMIANNGRDLIRDLEYVGRCPSRPLTRDHVEKVCVANNYSQELVQVLGQRLAVARAEYGRVAPFLATLPPGIASAAQEVEQHFLNLSMDAPAAVRPNDIQPNKLREHHPVWTSVDGQPVALRSTLRGYADVIWSYFEATENVRSAMRPFARLPSITPETTEFWLNHKINDRAATEYPPEASSDQWNDPR